MHQAGASSANHGGFFDVIHNTPYDWRKTYQLRTKWSRETLPSPRSSPPPSGPMSSWASTTTPARARCTHEFFPSNTGHSKFQLIVRFRKLGIKLLELLEMGMEYDFGLVHGVSVTFFLQARTASTLCPTVSSGYVRATRTQD